MTLPVPLTVRVGDRHIAREVSSVTFREEAIGGVKSIGFRVSRELATFDTNLTLLSEVTVYDGRSAEIVASGWLTDTGRSAGADGQMLDCSAFGPAQYAADKSQPLVYVDTRLDEWKRSFFSTRNATTQYDERGEDTPTLLVAAEEGKTIATSWQGSWIYRAVRRAGMKLARVRCDWDSGVTNADFDLQIHIHTGDAASGGAADADDADTAGGTLSTVVGDANFANGKDVAELRVERNNSAGTGIEDHWFEFWDVSVKALRLDKSGAEITTGYGSTVTVLAHEVVADLLGRVLDQYDGANAVVSTSATYGIDQLAYPDPVTAEQVLADLMVLEPAYCWWVDPATGIFHWEAWPTTVRYETTLDGGGSFPVSANELFNEVTVRWTDKDGRPRSTTRTLACVILDDAGITRSTTIDLADEYGSSNAAVRAGDNFLAEHNVPANAGTIRINRPVRDLTTGRMVQPWEIKPRELIRVRGVESYPDALNASSNDGQTVFRIWTKTYNSDGNYADLELDTWSRREANALARLLKKRHRKR